MAGQNTPMDDDILNVLNINPDEVDFSDLYEWDPEQRAAFEERDRWEKDALDAVIAEFTAAGGLFRRADGCVPFQAEGTWRGYTFYFRSRHDRWTMTVGPATDDIMEIVSSGTVIAHGDDTDVWDEGNWSDPAVGFRFAWTLLADWLDRNPV